MGVAGGFAQLCHGRAAPLAKMRPGDWLIYYAPRERMHAGAPVRAFVALGRVVGERVYEVELDGRTPHRRDIVYEPVRRVALADVKARLHLAASPAWAMKLRSGHVELDAHDFAIIAAAMRAPDLVARRDR